MELPGKCSSLIIVRGSWVLLTLWMIGSQPCLASEGRAEVRFGVIVTNPKQAMLLK